MNNKKILASVIMLLSFGLLVVITLAPWEEKDSGTEFDDYRIVAHAMGGINGHTYTNSFEAFVANYEQGTRIFETDLLLTADGKLVARHEWTTYMSELLGQLEVLPVDKQGTVLDYDQFMKTPILDLYTPLDFEKILDLMQHYPDIYIVTDTKEFDSGLMMQEFQMLTDAARRRDPALLTRIVPQIYNRPMLDELNDIYAFPHIIYTLYESQDSDDQVISFAKERGVDITMPVNRATSKFVKALKHAGSNVYVHTLNDQEEIRKLSRMGVDGFYTDFISESEM
ncbi:phosphatidylinositol-specific phospholipase C/glycerophosphodiester phosphodiesterase family protein [Paenibacillus sp. sgz500958]|uniref:phosphatidylinositol-specific phospholipase C/glycerophosphodiester phosphodiesterase family protein n=1 Tax=Paenibacillus sp. sgz500958 TaxID=3242475 RepID=UPI0036D39577